MFYHEEDIKPHNNCNYFKHFIILRLPTTPKRLEVRHKEMEIHYRERDTIKPDHDF